MDSYEAIIDSSRPENREWKKRNISLNTVDAIHEGLDEMYPGTWRSYVPQDLIAWAGALAHEDTVQEAWDYLEPIRRSIYKATVAELGEREYMKDPQWMMRMVYQLVELYLDIMLDPEERTDEVE